MTKQELGNCVSKAVKQALDSVVGLTGFSQLISMLNAGASNLTENACFMVPTFLFPNYKEEDELVCMKNFLVWHQQLELDLCTNCCLSFYITHKLQVDNILTDKELQLNVAVLPH